MAQQVDPMGSHTETVELTIVLSRYELDILYVTLQHELHHANHELERMTALENIMSRLDGD